MVFAPSDLAKLIGITSGPNGHRSTLPTEEEKSNLLDHFNRQNTEMSINSAFWSEFSSQHLASFFKTFFQTPWDLDSFHFSVVTGYVLQAVVQHAYFSKFGREHPEEVAASLPVQLSRLVPLFEGVQAHPDSRAFRTACSNAVLLLMYTSEAYLVYQQHLESIPVTLVISESFLIPLRPLCNSVSSAFASVDGHRETRRALHRIDQLLDSGSFQLHEDDDDGRYISIYGFVWQYCGALLGEERVTECVVKGEMLMCGKCRAVRYCCRDHQRVMWKKHKKICFETSW